MEDDIFVIHITRKCNLDCRYCYEKDKRDYSFSIEEIESIIQSIEPKIVASKNPRVELLGGEPLLHIEGIKYALERVYRLNSTADFMITTNGTVYSKELVELFNYYKLRLFISLDGNRFMHNANRLFKVSRKGSFDKVSENTIKYLAELETTPYLSTTLNKYSIPYLYQGLKYFHSIGANNISLGIVAQDMTETNKAIIIEQAIKFCNDKELYYTMNVPMLTKMDLCFFIHSQQEGVVECKQLVNQDEVSDDIKKIYYKHFFFEEIRTAIKESISHE